MCLMLIVQVRIRGQKGTKTNFALLDSNNNSAVSAELANQLGIRGPTFSHSCSGIAGCVVEKAENVELEIAGNYKGAEFHKVGEAVTMSKLGLTHCNQYAEEAKRNWPYLKRARLETFVNVVPEVIIGEDHPHLTAHRTIMERRSDEPMVKRTVLGWVLGGRKIGEKSNTSINVCQQLNTEDLEKLMKMNFSLEAFGLPVQESRGSIEDKKALTILEVTSKKENKKWVCGLLWRSSNEELPERKQQAMTRMLSNERRLEKDDRYFNLYHDKMEEHIQKYYIR